MSLLKRIENGTTTSEDAQAVRQLMSRKVDQTMHIMVLRKTIRVGVIVTVVAGLILLAVSFYSLMF